MFDWVDRYIEQARPHVQRVGVQSAAYAERAIALLGEIRDAVGSEDFDEIRKRFWFTELPSGNNYIDVAYVPTGVEWELETISYRGTGGQAVVTIFIDGKETLYFVGNWQGTSSGNGLIIPGGSQIQFRVSVTGTAYVFFQFKESRRKPSKTGRAGGQYEWNPDDDETPDPRQSAQNESRHGVPGVFAGNNVIGDRAGRYGEAAPAVTATLPKLG